jgi:hypothetical protein
MFEIKETEKIGATGSYADRVFIYLKIIGTFTRIIVLT